MNMTRLERGLVSQEFPSSSHINILIYTQEHWYASTIHATARALFIAGLFDAALQRNIEKDKAKKGVT